MEMKPLLIVRNLKTHFVTWKGVVKALDGIDLEIYPGETLGLVGETGCGKSVTSYSIMGLLPPTQGTIVEGNIFFNGVELTRNVGKDVKIKYKGKKAKIKVNRRLYNKTQEFLNSIRGKEMSMIFQEPMTALNPVLSIGYQLTEPLLQHKKYDLMMRIIARHTLGEVDFNEIKNAVFGEKKERLAELSKDSLKAALIEQIRSIYYRKDLTILQKNELVDELRNSKRSFSFHIKIYKRIVESKHEGLIFKIPILNSYLMKPLRDEANRKAVELLRLVNIYEPESLLKAYPHELSGGMRQRVMIAMALSCDPKLLIADEPTTALDVTTQAQILDLMKDLKTRSSAAILFITHDLGVISDMADRIAVMYAGNIVEIGNKMQIFYNPKHPYTRGLLRSIPTEETMKTKLHIIPGSIPNMIDPPKGCKFHPRCEFAMDICSREKPPMKEIEEGHYVSCWLY
ncbi:MAG: ABC transporter ATP-binding protein [Thermoplasmata archaeon]|jgi:peptide/nickel transport system ATP-binding protein